MIKLIETFIREVLHKHYCTEFTQWEKKIIECNRIANENDNPIAYATMQVITYTRVYQERRCVICGKVQQESLSYL
jgi:hypothetical protein